MPPPPPRFRPTVLESTAYVIGAFHPEFCNRLQNEAFQPLSFAFSFRYSNWILERLHGEGQLPMVDAVEVTDDERAGRLGLSYGLVSRLLGEEPVVAQVKGGGGGCHATAGGFALFPTNLPTRIQLLLVHDDGYARGNWDSAPFRQWSRFIHTHLVRVAGTACADAFFRGIGDTLANFLPISIGGDSIGEIDVDEHSAIDLESRVLDGTKGKRKAGKPKKIKTGKKGRPQKVYHYQQA